MSAQSCRVAASVTSFGVPEAALVARAQGADHYELVLLGNARIQLRRVRSGSIAVLADSASGLTDLTSPARLSLTVRGAAPVQLEASVNGTTVSSVSDGDAAALAGSGLAGLRTTRAGVWFDDFQLYAEP